MEGIKTILEIISIGLSLLVSIGTAFVYLDQSNISIALMSHKEKIIYKILSILFLGIMMFSVAFFPILFLCWSESVSIIIFYILFFYVILNISLCIIFYKSDEKNIIKKTKIDNNFSIKKFISRVFNDFIIIFSYCLNISTLLATVIFLYERHSKIDILIFAGITSSIYSFFICYFLGVFTYINDAILMVKKNGKKYYIFETKGDFFVTGDSQRINDCTSFTLLNINESPNNKIVFIDDISKTKESTSIPKKNSSNNDAMKKEKAVPKSRTKAK